MVKTLCTSKDLCVRPGYSLACPVKVMKYPGEEENRRLVRLLEEALVREARLWKVPVFKNGYIQGTDTSSSQQQEVILWLGEMSRQFHFCPETYALGVCVLHRMLSAVKAQPKYLKCIAFTSLILAAKINEEDEVIGSVKDLVVQSGCNFSTAEILRMERIILDKLHWDLYTSTAVDFIHIFHALLVSGHPFLLPSIGSPVQYQNKPSGRQGLVWTRQVQHCIACHQLWQFKGSTLALAIITLELEELTPDWFSVCTDLMKKAQVDSAEFILCREIVDKYLHSLEFSFSTNAVYILDKVKILDGGQFLYGFDPQDRDQIWTMRATGRKRDQKDQGEVDEYYDGFRYLYNEEMTPESNNTEALFDLTQKNVSPCPPLHPAVN